MRYGRWLEGLFAGAEPHVVVALDPRAAPATPVPVVVDALGSAAGLAELVGSREPRSVAVAVAPHNTPLRELYRRRGYLLVAAEGGMVRLRRALD